MRTVFLSAALAAGLMAPALAQTNAGPGYPPPGYPPSNAQTRGYAPAYPPTPGYTRPAPPPDYSQAPPSPGYSQSTPAPAYPQSAPPPGYSQSAPPYGATQPEPSYPPGQPAPPPAAQTAPAYPPYQQSGNEPLSNRSSNIDQRDTRSEVAPNLPSPDLGPNASPVDFLRAAQAALVAGRTGETQEALEQAQTRLLDRSVPYGMVNAPSENAAVGQISQALHALAARDRAACMRYIEAAIPAAQAALR